MTDERAIEEHETESEPLPEATAAEPEAELVTQDVQTEAEPAKDEASEEEESSQDVTESEAAVDDAVDETDESAATTDTETQDETSDSPEDAAVVSPVPVEKGQRVWWWPYITYALCWIALVATTYVLLTGAQAETPAFRQEYYPYMVLAGLVLTALGPTLSLAVWFVAWVKAGKGRRGGLFTRALLRGAWMTFVGVALWVGCLVLVDALRLGIVSWGA